MKTNPCGDLSPVAAKIRDISVGKWGESRAIEIVGGCSRVTELLRKIGKFAQFDEPILITGPSGVGKESVASSCHLLSPRSDAPYISVNCPQYGEGNLSVSELFGHKKGAYTGAVADHKGLFETAVRRYHLPRRDSRSTDEYPGDAPPCAGRGGIQTFRRLHSQTRECPCYCSHEPTAKEPDLNERLS